MRQKRSRLSLQLLSVLFLSTSTSTLAVTTGRLGGRVADETGVPLPGVSVGARSPTQLGGEQRTETDRDGSFLYPLLAPGEFTVTLALDGFVSQELTGVQVRLDHLTELRVTLPSARFGDEIAVFETAPVVDPQQVSTGQTFTAEYISEMTGVHLNGWRNLVVQAAGVDPERYRRVMGSVQEGNTYLLDDMDATDKWFRTPSYAAGDDLPPDVLQEVALHTSGFEAEYGQATGAVVNVVTKSGGNQLEGTVDFRYMGSSLEESGAHYDPGQQDSELSRGSATLGGPIVQDRLWYFGAYGYGRFLFTPSGAPTTTDFRNDLFFGKLSWQASPAWSVYAKLSYEPATGENTDSSPFRSAEATSSQKDDILISSLNLTGLLGDDLLWSFRLGHSDWKMASRPADGDWNTIGHVNLDTGEAYGNAEVEYYDDDLDQEVASDLEWFFDDLGGSHDLKVGARLGESTYTDEVCLFGNGPCPNEGEGYAFYDAAVGGEPIPLLMWVTEAEGRQKYRGRFTAAYVQDAWRARPDLTLKLGLRWDRARYDNNQGKVMDLDKLQPRIGAAWDVTGSGLDLLRASWGRFMSPSTIVPAYYARSGSGEEYWTSCSILGLADPALCAAVAGDEGLGYRTDPEAWDPAGWVLFPGDVVSSEATRIADGLRPMYVDQWMVGFEHQLFDRTSIEVDYIHKSGTDLFEDTCRGNVPVPSADAACDYYLVANLPDLRSEYEAWMLRFESRALDRLHVLASWVVSDSKGSVDNGSSSTGDYDIYPHAWYNRYGYRSDQSRHRLKLSGYALLPWDVTVAVNAWWNSEFRWTPIGRAPAETGISAAYNVFLEPRGNRKGGSYGNVDLQIGKGFTFGSVRVRLLASAFNLLGTEAPIEVCTRAAGCGGGVELGDPVAWRKPRRYQVGLRVEF